MLEMLRQPLRCVSCLLLSFFKALSSLFNSFMLKFPLLSLSRRSWFPFSSTILFFFCFFFSVLLFGISFDSPLEFSFKPFFIRVGSFKFLRSSFFIRLNAFSPKRLTWPCCISNIISMKFLSKKLFKKK